MLGDKRSLTVCYQNGCYTCVCFDTESGQYAGGIDNILIATDKKIIVPKNIAFFQRMTPKWRIG